MQKTLMAFGDSNTHGAKPMLSLDDVSRHPPEDRWTGVLAERLGAAWQVIPEGHPGRTSVWPDPIEGAHKAGISVLPALLESHRPLDLVVVMLGTNDMKARFGLPACDVAFGVRNVVEMILRSEAGPEQRAPACLLVAPPPIKEVGPLAEVFAGASDTSRELGTRLREIAAETGAAFLDGGMVAEMSDQEGIHMDAANQRALGAAIAEAVLAMDWAS